MNAYNASTLLYSLTSSAKYGFRILVSRDAFNDLYFDSLASFRINDSSNMGDDSVNLMK